MLDRVAHDSGPVIIVGDFNMSDQSNDYQRITTSLRDTYREIGWGLGFTFPDFSYSNAMPVELHTSFLPLRPVVRLDYVFHNDDLQAVAVKVLPTSGGSDHRPVLAQLALISD